MNNKIRETHPHIQFKKIWEITSKAWHMLGQCEAFVKAISDSPILPEDHAGLLRISLIKGALATTAIEGNTLSEEEVEAILLNQAKLPRSRAYQETEVRNVIDALNGMVTNVIDHDKSSLIKPSLILDFHKQIGQNLGEPFDAIPGKFRSDSRVVGAYKAPDHKYVPELMQELCDWLLTEFHYDKGQDFAEVVIQAIAAHVFLEWIHPFGDGNGRTGRLLEFYILLRGGNPNIASHILSNHYNQTRSEYYWQLNEARKNRSLTQFIEYALLGFRDGLDLTLAKVQESQFKIAWERFIYDAFEKRRMGNRIVFKRRRKLMLSLPISSSVTLDEMTILNVEIAREYGGKSMRTIQRDVEELLEMKLIEKNGKLYMAKSEKLMSTGHLPRHRIMS
jgi:Fic family protein